MKVLDIDWVGSLDNVLSGLGCWKDITAWVRVKRDI